MRRTLAGLSLLLAAGQAQAQPAVSSADGFVHGQSATIEGSDFGQKDPAAPALWIDGESHAPGTDASTADGWSSVGGASVGGEGTDGDDGCGCRTVAPVRGGALAGLGLGCLAALLAGRRRKRAA